MAKQLSKQPRFTEPNPETFFIDVMRWTNLASEEVPVYKVDTRQLDRWLSEFWHMEPHLAGVLNSVISIDANRGWTLTGGRNQVMRWTQILHNWMAAPGVAGWRPGCSASALSYYTSNLGGVVEIGRDGKSGPVRKLYHVDPTMCHMTGIPSTPLAYSPGNGKEQKWVEADYLRVVSMPSILEKMRGIGYCALMRCLTLAQIMVAVYLHDKEQLGARAPRGLLLLSGVNERQWEQAMTSRKAKLEGEGYQYFNAVATLMSSGMEQLDAKLIALSNLPANFDLQKFTSMLMYGYALCFGYDPSEFYPVQFGSLGRGTEGEVQHMKATSKGGMNFALSMQEQLQREDVLPPTLAYEFEERDDEGMIMQAQAADAWVTTYRNAREAGLQVDGQGSISREEMRVLLSEQGIIPREWTFQAEEVEATDEEEAETQMKERLLELPSIWKAAERFPEEPIVRYSYPGQKIRVLWKRADELFRPRVFRLKHKRAKDEVVYYEEGDVKITDADVARSITNAGKRVSADYAALLNAGKWEEKV